MHVSASTPRQCSFVTHLGYVTHPYLSTCECSHQTHVGHGHVDIPRHAQSVMGPECSNYHEGSELCNIANGYPINSAQRVLNNTEVKERNTICRHACFGVYASSVQLCNTSRVCDASVFIHMRVLTPNACGTRPRRHTQTCAECHGARVLQLLNHSHAHREVLRTCISD